MIPFGDLSREYSLFSHEIQRRINRSMSQGIFLMGKELEEFECRFADYLGVSYVIGVSSGTDALIICLRSLDIEVGSEVLLPVNTAIPTVMATIIAGYKPVFVDINPGDLLMNLEDAQNRLSISTRAIIPVHLYGNICQMDKIIEFAKAKQLFVIEDCAQAHGGTYQQKSVGSWGNCNAFSFYPSKNIGAYGDAGAVATNDKNLYEKCCQIRSYGEYQRYHINCWGGNFRMDEFQAAVLNTKLSAIDNLLEKRKISAEYYQKLLKHIPTLTTLNTSNSVYHLLIIRIKYRDQLQQYLAQNGIQTQIHYPVLLSNQPFFQQFVLDQSHYPIAESINPEILSLPLFNFIRVDEIEQVCRVIEAFAYHIDKQTQ